MLTLAAGPYVPDQAAITGGPPSARVSPTAVAVLDLDGGHSLRTGIAPDCMPEAIASRASAVVSRAFSTPNQGPSAAARGQRTHQDVEAQSGGHAS